MTSVAAKLSLIVMRIGVAVPVLGLVLKVSGGKHGFGPIVGFFDGSG